MAKSRIQLSEHFTYAKLIRFVIPSVVMMIFTSVYGMVDGLFVSNCVGKTPFAALNLIWPLIMLLGAFGFMMGTGGTAIVAKTLGEGDRDKANGYFSFIVLVTALGGVALGGIGFFLLKPVGILMGAEGETLRYCILYGGILLCSLPFFMLQLVFQSFFVTAEKPKLGLAVTIIAGVSNIVLDWLFIVVFDMGLAGAALATAINQCLGGIIPVVYFLRKNDSLLAFKKPKFYGKVLFKTFTNGSSEFMGNVSASIVSTLFNVQLMKIAGEDGVSAYGVLMYISFVFASIFFGYSVGSAPIISYHYGACNTGELKNLFAKSLRITLVCGVLMTVACFLAAYPLSTVFVGYDKALYEMTVRAFFIYSVSFLFSGINIFGSSLFTALNNGLVSAVISFLRTFAFQIILVLILPEIMGIDGIWLSIVLAEVLALAVTVFFTVIKRKQYNYI